MKILQNLIFMSSLIFCQGRHASNCFEKVADIVFALDSSSSIREWEFVEERNFLESVVDGFEIGHNNIQVGVLTFNEDVKINFHLNEYKTKHGLKRAIKRIPLIGGGTNIAKAIKVAREEMFVHSNGHRKRAAKILVVITDGFPNNVNDEVEAQLEGHFAKHTDVTILAIGVGHDVQKSQLEIITKKPAENYVFKVNDYGALKSIKESVSTRTCENTESHQNDEGTGNEIEDNAQAALEYCGGKPADVYFVLDSSSSIWFFDFQKQLQFVQNVIDMFDVSPQSTRIGVITYSNYVQETIPLDNNYDKEDLKREVSGINHITGETNTAEAIRYLRQIAFTRNMVRQNVAHVAIVITDGKSMNSSQTAVEARLARQDGIYLFAVGVGGASDSNELKAIANNPDENFVFRVENFDALSSIRDLLAFKTCEVEKTHRINGAVLQNPVCNENGLRDIVFVFDAFSLGGERSTKIREGIVSIVKLMNVEHDRNTQIGVVHDVTSSNQDIGLKTVDNESAFEYSLRKMKKDKMKRLLSNLRHHSFKVANGGRPNAQHIGVIFLDSEYHVTDEVLKEALRATSKILLYVIIIGDEIPADAERISSKPSAHYLMHVPRYDQVASSATRIMERLCSNPYGKTT